MQRQFLFLILYFISSNTLCQNRIDSFLLYSDVKFTIDAPIRYPFRETIMIIYVLPNGNTTEQTMCKKLSPGDDWHFDIQHIKAQTAFLRNKLEQNIIVAYLEN